MATYGPLALVVWFSVFGATILLARGVMALGFRWQWLDDATGGAGSWVAAYAVAKVLSPARIALVVTILPVIARWRRRWAGERESLPLASDAVQRVADPDPDAPA
jgi:hypothetical protein